MVKSILGVNHQGLRDWIIQRLSAAVMVFCTLGIVFFLITHPHLQYADWRALFTHSWVKVATLLFFLSLMLHAWVGMWTIFTDYIKCFVMRSTLHTIVLLALISCFFAGLLIVWGI